MKKIIISLSIIVVALIAAEAYYFISTLNKASEVVKVLPLVKAKTIQSILYKESGEVTYKRPTDISFQTLSTSSVEIPNLTSVRTGSGRGSVLLPNNSLISLSENTEISVNYTDQATSIFQSIGTTYHRVEALISGKTYEVQTPGTLAAVRGTKFAVSYDKVKSITKVAVTENKVSVARIQKSFVPNSTTTVSTEVKLEEVEVNEGDMAKVIEAPVSTTTKIGGKPSKEGNPLLLVVTKIDIDIELKTWIDENKRKDLIIDKIKSENTDKSEYRKELENLLKVDTDEVPKKIDFTDTPKPTTPIENKIPVVSTTTKPVIPIIKPISTTTPPVIIKKISEDVFFDKFNTLFVKDFYVENDDKICDLTINSSAKVKEVSDYAKNSGYVLPDGSADSLLKFGDDITYYCKNGKGDARARTVLQGRFDDEFPFKQNI